MRYYRDKLYLVMGETYHPPTQTTNEFVCVVLGSVVRSKFTRDDVCGPWTPDGGTYRIEDGHLPDYQPRVKADRLAEWLRPGRYHVAHAV